MRERRKGDHGKNRSQRAIVSWKERKKRKKRLDWKQAAFTRGKEQFETYEHSPVLIDIECKPRVHTKQRKEGYIGEKRRTF